MYMGRSVSSVKNCSSILFLAVSLFLFIAGPVLVSCSISDKKGPVPADIVAREQKKSESAPLYPIILVHGFMGFGRGQIPNIYYWGGFSDLQEQLKTLGYPTFTAEVGPVSSNWDRACELYAFIKGGTVDYGAAHSEKHGHARYGRTYPGVFPEWDGTNKIHIFGHSMGGQTARVLVHLLEEGSEQERNADPAGFSPLFAGNKNWVESVTTLSTPHNGTTLLENQNIFRAAQYGAISFFAALQKLKILYFDFNLDHFGLTLRGDESIGQYTERVLNFLFGEGSGDSGTRDASVRGASELNGWVKTSPRVYYFSWATEQTVDSGINGFQIPELGMNGFLNAGALYMGSYQTDGPVVIDSSWWNNDGVVNTRSMRGPEINSSDIIIAFDGNPSRGVWNYRGVLKSTDHVKAVGIGKDMLSWYASQAEFLAGLDRE